MMRMYRKYKLQIWYYNIVNKQYQHDSTFLFTLIPSKTFEQLLIISRKNYIYTEKINSEFSYIKVWFTKKIEQI